MKKFRFNRFNMIIFCASLVLLISFLLVYLNTFSDYVKKDPSKINLFGSGLIYKLPVGSGVGISL